MTKYNPQKIAGKWVRGYALDVHTLSSIHVGINEAGHDVFDTTRSELGELLYRLKFRGDETVVKLIVDAAIQFLEPSRSKFDLIVPVPPSGNRKVQPVILLATGIGEGLSLPVIQCVKTTRPTEQLKGVQGIEKRKTLLDGLHAVDTSASKDKNVLLFDDLYRSGATMNAITELLLGAGQAATVRALAITRTRINQ
jgi:competence protein ComFC